MKNFWQFMLPIIIILIIGTLMIIKEKPDNNEKRLYIKCNNISEHYEVYSGKELVFAEKDEKCKLDVKILDVNFEYIKLNTKYLLSLNQNGEIDKEREPTKDNIISYKEETIFYSYDNETKYTFQYK